MPPFAGAIAPVNTQMRPVDCCRLAQLPDGGKEIDVRCFAQDGVRLRFLPDLETNLDDADRS